ncbi:MAG TPA: hypothetical protein VFX53_00605 [Pedococcus sp.]|nr:hypothetical protein [Pedococcus sp.]
MAPSQPRTPAGAVRACWSTARGEDGERHSVATDTDTQALWPATTGAAAVEGATRVEVGRALADGRGAGLAGRVLEGAGGVGLELTDPLLDAADGTVDGTVEVAVAGAVELPSGAPHPANASSTAMATGTPALRRIPTGSWSAGRGAAARVVGP